MKKILTPLQEKFLKAFFQSFLKERFFLGGGTALAEFYLHHRLSQDLDFFTLDQDLSFDGVNAEIIKLSHQLKLVIDHQVSSPSFLQYIFQGKRQPLKVDVVKDVPIRFGEAKDFEGIKVDSLENIAVNKLLAVFGRADAKDFIDLYFLLEKEKKLDFDDLFKNAQKKDLGLHEFYLAGMLSYVERIKLFPETVKPFDKKKLVKFFLDLSEELLKRIKPEG